mmetsp:Transcript_49027/g.115189  ORF Transcript_49027/g.115189 Transcript_49027/m.115189 type:complete len:217 (-) Transcript_49027:597-1247(-)
MVPHHLRQPYLSAASCLPQGATLPQRHRLDVGEALQGRHTSHHVLSGRRHDGERAWTCVGASGVVPVPLKEMPCGGSDQEGKAIVGVGNDGDEKGGVRSSAHGGGKSRDHLGYQTWTLGKAGEGQSARVGSGGDVVGELHNDRRHGYSISTVWSPCHNAPHSTSRSGRTLRKVAGGGEGRVEVTEASVKAETRGWWGTQRAAGSRGATTNSDAHRC